MCYRFNYKLSFKLQVQGRVTRQPPGTLIQFRITATLSPLPRVQEVRVWVSSSRDSLQLANFSCFLFSSLLLRRTFESGAARIRLLITLASEREGSLLYTERVRFTRVALTDKWPAIIAGLSQQPRVRDRGRS